MFAFMKSLRLPSGSRPSVRSLDHAPLAASSRPGGRGASIARATIEALEDRKLLSTASAAPEALAPHVGRGSGNVITSLPDATMNMAGVNYFNTDWAFANAFKRAGQSNGPDPEGNWKTNGTYPMPGFNSSGYPKSALQTGQHLSTLIYRDANGKYPSGTWKLRWGGNAELEIRHAGKNASGGNVSTAAKDDDGAVDLAVAAGTQQQGFEIRILKNDPNNPVKNIEFWMPGQQGKTFHPTFKDRLKPFGVLRMMNWGQTNNSPIKSWADRPLPSDATWTTDPQDDVSPGVPYEIMVQLANETDSDLWITVPHETVDGKLSTADDYIKKLARLIRYGAWANGDPAFNANPNVTYKPLKANLNVWIEYSNETWNFVNGFQQQNAYVKKIAKDNGLTNSAGNGIGAKGHGLLSRDLFETMEEELGRSRIVRVVAGQLGDDNVLRQAVDQLPSRSSKGGADVLATTTYFGKNLPPNSGIEHDMVQSYVNSALNFSNANDTLSSAEKTTAFDLIDDATDYTVQRQQEQADVADDYGVPLVAYEGNQHLDENSLVPKVGGASGIHPNLDVVLADLTRDNRMYWSYRRSLDLWKNAVGGETIAPFSYVAKWTGSGQWGHLEYQDQPTSQATLFRALTDWIDDNEGFANSV